ATMELELTVIFPFAPDVPETRLKRDPEASVSTLAVMPAPEELMAAASPESVLSDEILMVCAGPLPACSVTEPDSLSEALDTSARYPLDVVARLLTDTLCVPARAEESAAVRLRTLVSELEPVFSESIPSRSVSELMSLERLENSVPKLEMAVSWVSSEANCVFH